MRIIITREPDFKDQHYCIMQFKGKFQTDQLPSKSLVHMGSLHQVKQDQYRLQIGVMDLVGKLMNLEEGWLYTQTREGMDENEKVVVVKGIVKTKIIFDKRPCPNMQRTEIEPRMQFANNLFKQLESK